MTAFSANIDVPLEERLAAIVESSDDAIISKNLDGIILTWNEGATRLFGYAAEEAVGRSVTMLIPEDRPNEELEILARLRRGERISHYETVRRRKDGHLVDISLTVSPIKNARGIVVGASKIARDITERKKAHEQQSLLLQEMNHRINNLYAVARNIVSLSARSSTTPAEMAQAITGRLDALASAQRLAHPESHDRNIDLRGGTTLDALIRVIASPYDDPARNRGGAVVVADGPVVCIDAQAVSAVSLVLHELATNAVKYGALSADGGCAHIVWAVEGDRLVLQWQESGGPAIAGPPDRSGSSAAIRRTPRAAC